jgi:hypothetical protein
MKKFIIALVLSLTSLIAVGQCNGISSFNMTPVAPPGGYLPGTVVNVCYTMTGYSQAGSNWVEGFDLTLGPGWTGLTPGAPPANCGGNTSGGQWIWMNVCNTPVGPVGPGWFFDLNNDGNPANDFGDSGSCTWTFCFTVTVAQGCTPQSLLIQVTPGSDGLWGSWNSTSCDLVTPFNVYNGNSSTAPVPLGPISHN